MHSLKNTRRVKFLYSLPDDSSVCTCENKLGRSRSGSNYFNTLVNISISVTGYCNGLCPVLYIWLYSLNDDWSSEYCTVHDGSDCSIWTSPHFLKLVLFNSLGIRSNCGTLYSNTVFLGSHCSINSNLIIRIVSVLQSKVIVLCFQINIW